MPPKKPAFDLKASCKTPSGYAFQISLKIMDKLSTVGAMAGGMACSAVGVVGGVTYLFLNYPGLVKAVIKAALVLVEGVEAEIVGTGSILVKVLCTSKESFLLFMDAFETNKIRQRLEEEFQNKLNFKGELEVKITNEPGVYEDLDQLRRLEKKHAVEEVEGHMSVKTEVDHIGSPITAKPTTKKRKLEVAPTPQREQRQSSSSSTGDSMEIVKVEPIATKKRKLEVKPGCPSEEELQLLATELADDWRRLASRLNFKKAEITGFDSKHKNLADKAEDMLLVWQTRNTTEATYKVLYDALCHELVQNRFLAEKFCCP